VGGERRSVGVALVPLSEVSVVTRRWRAWVPWLVFGGGLAVVGLGGLVQVKAASDMDAYDRNIATTCGRAGCAGDALAALLDQKRNAELENRIGIGALAAGLGATAAGAAMLYLNRPRSRYSDRIGPQAGPAPSVAPSVAPAAGGAVLSVGGRF
jgi:hypothetical protein